MGKWSYSINGSDFIHDLLPEYILSRYRNVMKKHKLPWSDEPRGRC